MSQTIESTALAITPAQHGALVDALRVPDVSGIDLERFAAADQATLARSLDEQLASARALVDAVLRPLVEMRDAARANVLREIIQNGATALPHDTFNVYIKRAPGQRDKRVDVLMKLVDHVPADELSKALWIESVDVKRAEPSAIEALLNAGGKATWKADLTKLDPLGRKYGGEIAKIIAEGSPRGGDGPPVLVIEPRESAIRAVS